MNAHTPALLQLLVQSLDASLAPEQITAAYVAAQDVLMVERPAERSESIARWVQEAAETGSRGDDLKAMADYRHAGGTVQSAFMEPSFVLGFALAYLLLSEERR